MDTPYQKQSKSVIAFDLQFTFVFAQIPNVPEDNWVWSSQDAINMHLPERLVHSYLKKRKCHKKIEKQTHKQKSLQDGFSLIFETLSSISLAVVFSLDEKIAPCPQPVADSSLILFWLIWTYNQSQSNRQSEHKKISRKPLKLKVNSSELPEARENVHG